jgi:hypothetical protein
MKHATLLAILLSVTGCGAYDSLTEGFKHTEAVASDIEKAVGTKPHVGFKWSNGSLTNVSVTFDGIPANSSVTEIATLARRSIATNFKQEPNKVVIAFSFPGSNP